MADRVVVKDLALRCIIGKNPGERRDKQDVVITYALGVETRPAGESDRPEDAVDYRAINKRVIRHVEGSQHVLIEALAERIAAICLEDSRVLEAWVSVEKPGALRFARTVAVEVTRRRNGR